MARHSLISDLHGDQLVRLVAEAKREVVLIAPFLTRPPISRLLDACPAEVPITLVGRFLPEDVKVGVCHLEAAELLIGRPGCTVRASPVLHGKMYRVDDDYLIGSANLTLRGLGWASASNLELVVPMERSKILDTFEISVISRSEELTLAGIRDLQARVRRLPEASFVGLEEHSADTVLWLPRCYTPEKLYAVYAEQDARKILASAAAAARHDLEALAPVPLELGRHAFESWIAGALEAHPVSIWVRAQAHDGVEAEAAIEQIKQLGVGQPDTTPEQQWEIFSRWLLHFLPRLFLEEPVATRIVFKPHS